MKFIAIIAALAAVATASPIPASSPISSSEVETPSNLFKRDNYCRPWTVHGNVNCRASPSTKAPIVRTLAGSDYFYAQCITHAEAIYGVRTWDKIKIGGKLCWVSAYYTRCGVSGCKCEDNLPFCEIPGVPTPVRL